MTEWNDFDRELMESLEDLPPSPEVVAAVTPWREAMSRILWGLFLTTFHINNLYLQYLLPAIGTAMLYLGFRSLRNANRFFKFGWVISGCKAILLYINFVMLATPLATWGGSGIPLIAQILFFSLIPLLYASLWLGLRQSAREVGHHTARQPALWALLWYGVLTLLGLYWPKPGMLLFLVMIGLYIAILKALWGVTKELEDWGYGVQAAPVKVSADQFKKLYLGILAAVIVLTAVFSCHQVPGFLPADPSEPDARLTELGLPADTAALLLPEDQARLLDAERCDPCDNLYGNDGDNLYQSQIYSFLMPDGSLQLLQVFVPGDKGGLWKCRLQVDSNAALSDLTCRLFYQDGAQRMVASPPFLEPAFDSGIDYFGSPYENYTASLSPFSWPVAAKDRLVYILYTADQEANPKTVFNPYIGYGQDPLPVYPYDKERSFEFRAGASYYYGDGSSLMYKADEAKNS